MKGVPCSVVIGIVLLFLVVSLLVAKYAPDHGASQYQIAACTALANKYAPGYASRYVMGVGCLIQINEETWTILKPYRFPSE